MLVDSEAFEWQELGRVNNMVVLVGLGNIDVVVGNKLIQLESLVHPYR